MDHQGSHITLLEAASLGSLVSVRAALSHPSCNLLDRDEDGNTALHIAASSGYCDIVEELAGRCTTFSTGKNRKGHTPIHLACSKQWLKCVIALANRFPCDLMETDNLGNLPLHLAALFNNGDILNYLLERLSGDPELPGCEGKNCLHLACCGGHVQLARNLLVKYKCRKNAVDDHGSLPIHCSAFYGHVDVLTMLINEFDYSPTAKRSTDCCSVLHQASAGMHVKIVDILINNYQVDPNTRSSQGETALHWACMYSASCLSNFHYSGDIDRNLTIDMLIDAKCDPMTEDNVGRMALHYAALYGQEQVVRLLVMKYNCPVNYKDNNGNTPLHCAAMEGCKSVVQLLLSELLASFEIYNKQNNSALNIAALNGHSDIVSLLVEQFGCTLHTKGYNNRTPLHQACDGGHLELMEKLIDDYRCDLMAEDDEGLTPLHVAALGGMEHVVRQLVIKYRCQVNCKDNNENTPLHHAAAKGHANVVQVLLSELGIDIHVCNKQNDLALNVAARNGHSNVVSLLVEEFLCSPHTKGFNSRTPLHQACDGGHLELVEKLIDDYHCDPMAKDDEGLTPLHVAAFQGNKEIVKQLVTKYNCPVDCTDNGGDTPLHLAAMVGHADIVQMMTSEFKANFVHNQQKDSALNVAARNGHIHIVSLLVEQFGCSPHTKGFNNRTPLHQACGGAHLELVEKLIDDYHCDPTARDMDGHTALHLAAFQGNEEIVRQLVTKYKCPVDCTDNEGDTPLHLAATEGRANTVQMMMSEFGANIVRNKQNDSALNVAARNGHSHVISYLVDHFGCSPHTKGFNNRTPLHQACGGGHLELVEKLIDDYHCDPLSRDDEGLTPLHVAALGGKQEIVKQLIFKYKCIPDIVNDAGDTLVHIATSMGHMDLLELLIDVIGIFPSVKNNLGKEPIDQKPLELLVHPSTQSCVSYVSKHAVGEYRQAPPKVLLFDMSIALAMSEHSYYSLFSLDHTQSRGLCYVNSTLSDIIICCVESGTGFNSSLLQRLMSGPLLMTICTVNMDSPIDKSRSEVCSQVSLVQGLAYQNHRIRMPLQVLLLGTASTDREFEFNAVCENIIKEFGEGSIRFCKHFLTSDSNPFPERVFPVISEYLIQSLSRVSSSNVPKITHGSIYLLKFLFREYGQKPYIKFSQLVKLLNNRHVMAKEHPEEILGYLRQLDSQGYLLTAETPENMFIIFNPFFMLQELDKISQTTSDSLAVMGIFSRMLLFSIFSEGDFSLIHSILTKLDFSLELPDPVVDSVLQGHPLSPVSDKLLFIPHLASPLQQEKCWVNLPEKVFSCGFYLKAVGKLNHFPSQFVTSLLLKEVTLFSSLLNAPHGSVNCVFWKSGIHWRIENIEVVVDVLDDGRCVAVFGRSDVCCQLMCVDIMVQVMDTVLGVKDMCCGGLGHKVYVLDHDALKMETIPLKVTTDVPCFDATTITRALRTRDRNVKTTFSTSTMKWLQRFSLQGVLFSMSHKIIFSFLEPVSEKWLEIAQTLGMSEEACHEISEANPTNSIMCCSQMVEELLMGSDVSTNWHSLTEALRTLNMEQLADEILLHWGHHAKVQQMLQNEQVASYEIEEPFLQQFAVVAEPHWSLLCPYINPLEPFNCIGADKEPVLSHLQTWKRRMRPTYGDLAEILSRLYIEPPIHTEIGWSAAMPNDGNCNTIERERGAVDTSLQIPNSAPVPCHHSCAESLCGLCSTPVHSGCVGVNGGTIECKELGFSIRFPPGAVNYPVTVSVCCTFKKQLCPPFGYEFVSPVYVLHVTADITFEKEVELSLNHWAKLNEDTRLIFALSPIPVGNSPCTLEPQNGGEFFPHHGTVNTKHFSLGAILRAISQKIFSTFKYITGLQPDGNSQSSTESEADELRENSAIQEESMRYIGSSTEEQPAMTVQDSIETDYSRTDSYQAFLVYPVNEFDTNNLWHSSLSVSLNHPVFTTSSIQWMRKNYPGFVWGNTVKLIEPQGDLVAVLEPEDSFAVIIGSEEIPKESVDLPRKWPEYADNQDIYPPRVMIALQRSSENVKHTISIKGSTGECGFNLTSPKLVISRKGDTEHSADTNVDKPTVQLLHRELHTVQHRWYGIGLQLGLPPSSLHTIQHDSGADCEMCMVVTCDKWLATNCDACWQDVANALTVIGHKVQAESIKTKYCICKS